MIARLYIRVSHEEQAKFGASLNAQEKALLDYCRDNNIVVADIYRDEGISASTITKRKAFVKMLDDVKNGELILFTKLDRFSRNLLDANLVIQELDKKNVMIKAIHEDDIDTTTADGKFLFNLKLSLAQREREKTSERIRDVFRYKISKGEVVSGSHPLGYKIVDKKLVIDEEYKDIVYSLFNYYNEHQTLTGTIAYLKDNYGIVYTIGNLKLILRNELYIGKNRDNYVFCQPIISKELFESVQHSLKKNIRTNPNRSIYIFSGLLIDSNCNHRMTGARPNNPYYKCNYNRYGNCPCKNIISERKLEKYIISNLDKEIEEEFNKYKITYKKKTKQNKVVNKEKLNDELNRLNILFQKGRIDEQYYDTEYNRIYTIINVKEETIEPPKKLEELLTYNWKEVYYSLNKENKRTFLRNIIDKIEIDLTKKEYKIFFSK